MQQKRGNINNIEKNNNKNYEYRNKHNLSKNITTHCKNYLFNTTF